MLVLLGIVTPESLQWNFFQQFLSKQHFTYDSCKNTCSSQGLLGYDAM